MATNYFKGKDYNGTFAGGEGPVKGQSISTEGEVKGIYGGEGGGLNLKVHGGPSQNPGGSEEKGFDLNSKSYAGPQNSAFKPVDKGTVSNTDINKG